MNPNEKFILGIDLGGTHCDGVILSSNTKNILKAHKLLLDHQHSIDIILEMIRTLLIDIEKKNVAQIILSTTLVVNALSYSHNNDIGILLISGIGMNPKELDLDSPYFILKKGYVNHIGQKLADLDKQELNEAFEFFQNQNIQKIVVVQKFSTRNHILEKEAIQYFTEKKFKVFPSSHLSGELNFPRRCYTGLLNALSYDLFSIELLELTHKIKETGLNTSISLLKTDGGHIPITQAINYPIETILSGPSASIVGSYYILNNFLKQYLEKTILTIDIGGTTTDLGLIDKNTMMIKKHIPIMNKPTLVEGVLSHSILLGGDTLIEYHNGNISLQKKKGLSILFGGDDPTCTDFLEAFYFHNLSHQKILGEYFNISNEELSYVFSKLKALIFEIISRNIDYFLDQLSQKTVYTIKDFYYPPKNINLNVFFLIGAASYYFKPLFNELFKEELILPEHFGVMNAIGAASSLPSLSLSISYSPVTKMVTISELNHQKSVHALTKKDAENYLKEYFIKTYKEKFNQTISNDDCLIYESENFAIIKNGRKIGESIRLKIKRKFMISL